MPVTITETWPEGYVQNYEGYLYNHETFIPLQLSLQTSQRSFYAIDTSAKSIVGKAHFFKEYHKNQWRYSSPLKSPFGSFEFHEKLTQAQADEFMKKVIQQLKTDNPAEIHILQPATIYHPEHTAWIEESLIKLDFRLMKSIPNHHILVSSDHLEKKMHTMERRRLKKCQKSGFIFQEEPLTALPEIYDFILACRKERGWGLSMSMSALQKAVKIFPENYKLFSIYDGQEKVAATVAILVNTRILYNFYPASLLRYQAYSPTVMLLEGLYHFYQQHNIEILDLGTSATNSLRQFKAHMGGEVTYKHHFIYSSIR